MTAPIVAARGRQRAAVLATAMLWLWGRPWSQAQNGAVQEWPAYAADPGGSHYSPLADVTRQNVTRLQPAWQWKPAEEPMPEYGTRPGMFENTPLMIDNVLYLSTPYNRVVALDAETGAQRWAYDPKAYVAGQPPNGTGFVHRGVAAWRD
ncbi:MAG: hypothetical protein ABIX28_00820 [Vicinamibacterales bacterium]